MIIYLAGLQGSGSDYRASTPAGHNSPIGSPEPPVKRKSTQSQQYNLVF